MSEPTPLADFHRANGAVFGETGALPVHFGDPAREYAEARDGAGLIDRADRGLLQFTGPDRVPFLQGMLSNDLRALKPFDGQNAAILTQQGKVIADVRVLCAMNSFYLDFWASLKEKILAHLNRYLVADEVEIADRSNEYVFISVCGPRAEALVRAVASDADLPSRTKQHAMITLDGAAVCIVREDPGAPVYDLILPRASAIAIARRLTAAGTPLPVAWIGTEAQEVLRVEAGIPLYGVDFGEENLLLEVGLADAVSFTKGCYLGQEIVERIRSRGHVNKKLCGLVLDGAVAAQPGDQLQSGGKEAGAVTSSVLSPRLGRPIALGYVAKEFWEPGTVLTIERGAGIRARVTELPFAASS
jgi:folate-binding protein YgfZ